MRNFFGLIIAVASCGVIKAMTEADAISALESFGDKCDPVPDEQDYIDIVRNKPTVRKSTECFRLCLMDQMEMLTNCKLDTEKLKDLVSMFLEDKDKESTDIANICNAKVTCEDKCTAAHNLAMCLLSEFRSRKWPIPELEERK